jgi:hypothetical protein
MDESTPTLTPDPPKAGKAGKSATPRPQPSLVRVEWQSLHISYRHLAEMMQERSFDVHHTTMDVIRTHFLPLTPPS